MISILLFPLRLLISPLFFVFAAIRGEFMIMESNGCISSILFSWNIMLVGAALTGLIDTFVFVFTGETETNVDYFV